MPRAFTRDSGQLLTFRWSKSPEEMEREFIQLAEYYDDVSIPLGSMLEIAKNDTEQRFEQDSSPDHVPWVGLTQDYQDRKAREGFGRLTMKILEREGELKHRAPQGWTIVGESIVYDPAILPRIKKGKDAGKNLGLIHQEGSMGDGSKGHNLPARPFIGLSPEAIAEIEFVWETWVEAGVVWWDILEEGLSKVSIFTHPSGREQFRIGGRWGPNV